jgi:hypothetical protein
MRRIFPLLFFAITFTIPAYSEDLRGIELLRIARVAHGGEAYRELKQISSKSSGYLNIAPFTGVNLGAMGNTAGAVELKVTLSDYQNSEMKRRLEVEPMANMPGKTFLSYTGAEGGGMFMNNPFRMSDTALPRQWAWMGFSTLNRAVEGQYQVARQRDEREGDSSFYVVEVKFSPSDTVRFWINQKDFLISRVVTRYNSRILIEETRSDYRRVGCLLLPHKVVTRQNGMRLADLTIEKYDLESSAPSNTFSLADAR